MNTNEEALKSLADGIKLYIDNAINKASFDKTKKALIVGINADNTYKISLDNRNYDNISAINKNCNVNEVVNVLIPCNNYNDMYII